MRTIQTRRGAILLWRLGNIEYGEQSRWSRAPRSRGMWAFPYPFYEPFLTHHKYADALPKRLRTHPRSSVPVDRSWIFREDGAPVDVNDVVQDERGWLADGYEIDESFWEAQRQWLFTFGKRIVPIRRFWYEGAVYSHMRANGEIGGVGTMGFDGDSTDWYRIHSSELAQAIRRNRGVEGVERLGPGLGLSRFRYSQDHMEVFLAPHDGRIRSPRPIAAQPE